MKLRVAVDPASSVLTMRSGSAFSTSIAGAAPRRAGARVPDASRGIRAEWVSISKFPMISSVQPMRSVASINSLADSGAESTGSG